MKAVSICVLAVLLAGCAGRNPEQIETFSPIDDTMSCKSIEAEIKINNRRVKQLATEKNWKLAQNVAAGVGGVFIPVLWFGMDFKGAAASDMSHLQLRQQRLSALLREKNCARSL